MSSPKLRLEEARLVEPGVWALDGEARAHARARRLADGDEVEGLLASDGARIDLRVVYRGDEITLEQIGEPRRDDAPAARITLALALLKADQFDDALRTCGELGVERIVPLACERSVPKILDDDGKKLASRTRRWKKILSEATKVSGVARPPMIDDPIPFRAIKDIDLPRSRLAAIISPTSRPIARQSFDREGVALAIGPEGDWTDDEISTLVDLGFSAISLGPRVLRASTAVAAALSFLMLSSLGR